MSCLTSSQRVLVKSSKWDSRDQAPEVRDYHIIPSKLYLCRRIKALHIPRGLAQMRNWSFHNSMASNGWNLYLPFAEYGTLTDYVEAFRT